MAEFIDDDAPLPSLEDFLVDSLEELKVSSDELSINGKCENLLFVYAYVDCLLLKFRCAFNVGFLWFRM